MPTGYWTLGNGAGWVTTTSSTASNSYLNPFFGATGGTGTYTSTTTTDSLGGNSSATFWYVDNIDAEEMAAQARRDADYHRRYQEMILAQEASPARQAERERNRAAAAMEAARAQADAAEVRRKQEAARVRARGLLLEHLSTAQRDTFEKNGWFIVEGGKTKTKYRIRNNSYAGNIDVYGKIADQISHRLCVHCSHDIPLEDHLLAQKLMLEFDEETIVKKANRHAA